MSRLEGKMISIQDKMHWVVIKVFTQRGPYGTQVEYHKWDRMTFEQRTRWDWYFKYRAALLQVKYPKHEVEFLWGNEDAVGKTAEHILRDKIAAKKRTITKHKNIKKELEKNWKSLFPIEEEHHYKLLLCKISRLEEELKEIEK